jgi:hypothetical protein
MNWTMESTLPRGKWTVQSNCATMLHDEEAAR